MSIVLVLLAITLVSAVMNGLLNLIVGKGIMCYTKSTSKLLFYTGFFATLLMGVLSLVLNSCGLKEMQAQMQAEMQEAIDK